ncbi:MAG: hypothetical protein HRU32_17160, partial [Rhodobacteraceae bacterium]|nr:hypothetical protein [Paracoccaceae bacterium]
MRDPLTAEFLERGWAVLPASPATHAWAEVARGIAEERLEDPAHDTWYRHDRTWFAGVDVLPNDPDGALGPVALAGPALTVLGALGYPVTDWHAGQMSAVFPGYPGRDAEETDASAGFRRNRDAAHVDGLLPIGPNRRRMLREPHAFVLGIPLSPADKGASPLAVWDGSHRSIGAALCSALAPVAE